ncbi:MAG: ArnT family glycosyltransferase [Phycisphaerales bacterium]
MAHHPSNDAAGSHAWRTTLRLVAVVTLARLAALLWVCTIPLIEDEAFYWEWGLRPALSYYTKGPGIAWLIRASTELLGTSEFGVRASAPICGAVVALCVAAMARMAGGPRAALFACVCVLCAPMLQAASLLMTIDGPYAACWAVCAWAGMYALLRHGRWSWALAGAALGVGFLFKYTIVALPISLACFAMACRRDLRLAPGWKAFLAAGTVLAMLGTVPVLVWNAQRDWPTLSHLLGHLGVRGGDMPVTQGPSGWRYSPAWTATYLASPLGLIGPAVIAAAAGVWRAFAGRGVEQLAERRLLATCAAPLLVFYLAVSFVTEPEGNWAMAAFITALALAGVEIDRGMSEWEARFARWRALPEPRPRQGWVLARPQSGALLVWWATLVVGTVAGLALPLADRVAAAMPRVVPASRLTGIRDMAAHADRTLAELAARDGGKPFLIAMHYGRAAQLRFYMKGRPKAYCSGRTLGHGRVTQYDFWEDTDLKDPALIGRPALVVGGTEASWAPFFGTVGAPFTLDGDRKRSRPAFVCSDYKGPGAAP